MPPVAAIIVAAGRGTRMGGEAPKQFHDLAGRSVLARAVEPFSAHPLLGSLVVVVHADEHARSREAMDALAGRVVLADGGETRRASVQAGLQALADQSFPQDGIVLVQDAARPLVSEGLITRAIAAALRHGAAVPGLAVADTIKRIAPATMTVAETLDRQPLRAIQTPQSFRFGLLAAAHASVPADNKATDDAMLAEAAGHAVAVFDGDAMAFKLTTPEDMARARLALGGRMEPCTGQGFDVHRFGPGDHVMLGGVRLPHSHGLVGHSDADVLLHAITDAILGALADGDIGQHFPPSDMRWRGAPSRVFLEDAVRRVANRGGRLVNLDCMVLAEAPRVLPHAAAIRANLAGITGLPPQRIGIKATTTETLGFVGRREGMAAMASATVLLPEVTP
jgi:2-C-methyl-D-erythritol 4-phosphate cytidylyltransferase/2-C-methyl-D-erythritol 2,4-cyclodiphosphate synthase